MLEKNFDLFCFSIVALRYGIKPIPFKHTFTFQTNRKMWYDSIQPGQSWATLWSGLIRCECGGIRTYSAVCSVCGAAIPNEQWADVVCEEGTKERVLCAQMGAEGRYEDWVYLQMIQQEWLRPITDADRFLNISKSSRPSARAIVILVFWTYFETRVERLCQEPVKGIVPENVLEDLLRRYASVGARLDRLYRILYSTTYSADLKSLGFEGTSVLLETVQRCRNEFAHGHPEAIDDALVESLIQGLKTEHEAWIAVFNKRMKERKG